ncbi:MAG: ATP-dependent RNA helicase HrpA [Burkholderiales bacterium]
MQRAVISSPLEKLYARLPQTMAADTRRLSAELRRFESLARAGKAPAESQIVRLSAQIDVSVRRRQLREENLPRPDFDLALPINEQKKIIADAITNNQIVIICGETGSGKTTQIPKICLELKRGAAGFIGCTQPRRIAARSVASRLADELRIELGQAVGYKVRFTDKTKADSYIKVMTDGILLAETHSDRDLAAYDTIIIDEAHERSLNIDFLLGYVKQLAARRADLKIIITSATIDAERFSKHFDGAPVVEVSGRLYPVEVCYRPLEQDEGTEEGDINSGILAAVDELWSLGNSGDVLVFLPGEREIREAAEALRKHHPPGVEILPLYARLSAAEQDRVFKPAGARRIVLATNVAETSLTVPGIRYVIDTGHARLLRYSVRNKVDMLQVENISQAAAKQRSGRCGRVANGVAIRLYTEEDFNAREAFTPPEILRTSLAGVILKMAALNLGDVENFPFIDSPSSRAITDGYLLLAELNAVDEQRRLTSLGKQLARLPIDPRVGRMLLAAQEFQCLTEMLIITAALSVQDPKERPNDKQDAANRAHEKFLDEKSDFSGLLKLWHFFQHALEHKKSNRKLIELCHENYLSHFRMREWREIHTQLHAQVVEMGMRLSDKPASYEQIHRALLAGLLGNIGCRDLDGDSYKGAREVRFVVSSGSGLRKQKYKWVIAAELQETNRVYARTVAKIEPEWIESAAAHLVKRHYFDPHWEKSAAQVSAYERVTLYGLTVMPKRRIHYGTVNPDEAREIFIRQALVAREYATRAQFFENNRQLIVEVEELEHKARRQDVLIDDETLFGFYAAIIPNDIFNGAGFEDWRKDAEKKNPSILFLTRDYLMRHAAAHITEEQFPDAITLGNVRLPLTYRFEPGHILDGLTLTAPLHLLNQINEIQCEWLVPGLLREKLAWYLKALPKALRRLVVPVPDFVTAFLQDGDIGRQPIPTALREFIHKQTGEAVAVDVWQGETPPVHLLMNFRITDDAGRELGMGRDLKLLRSQLGEVAQLTFGKAEPGIERDNIKAWDFGDLPKEIHFSRQGQKLTGFPALVDQGDSVSIKLFDAPDAADRAMRGGVARLLRLELREQMKQLDKTLGSLNQLAMQLRSTIAPDALKQDLLDAITDRAFFGDDALPRSEKEFVELKQRARARLPAVSTGLLRMADDIAREYFAASAKIHSASAALARPAADCRTQLGKLVYEGCFGATPWERLQHLPRYIKGISLRLNKYPGNPERDAKHAPLINGLVRRYEERAEKFRQAHHRDSRLDEFRWMLEELRISLFAQELKTPLPVSAKRLDKIWESMQ